MYNGEAKRPIFVESIKVETIWGGNNISKQRLRNLVGNFSK